MIPAFERAKTVHALDRATTVISNIGINILKSCTVTHIDISGQQQLKAERSEQADHLATVHSVNGEICRDVFKLKVALCSD
jgi:hypothetical protein